MRKYFALKFRKTSNQLENIWEKGNNEYKKYLSQENEVIAEASIAHHWPAQNLIHLQKSRYSRKPMIL